MEQFIADGRSAPGAVQRNDVEVSLWKNREGKRKP
jgi:hypothetical protein